MQARLTREDWARGAFTALAEGGTKAVAVEKLGARLGATKGSFYWHFRNRAELVDAALALFEAQDTEAVIALLQSLPDPLERLRTLFSVTHSAGSRLGIEAVVLAEADHPQVGPVLRRITHRRVDYMTGVLVELGLDDRDARHRALLAYQAWIGFVQLGAALPALLPVGQDAAAYLQHVLSTLEAGWPGAPDARPRSNPGIPSSSTSQR